jgi:hypothetical protein
MSDDRIKLNVGGTIFETYKSTLTIGSSYFQALLGGQYLLSESDSEFKSLDESEIQPSHLIFIDRDPEAFRAVLNYLRDPNGYIPWKYKNELDYYGIIFQPQSQDPTEISTHQYGLNNTMLTLDLNAEMGNLMPLVAVGSRNRPHPNVPSMYYNNYVNNCRYKKFPIKSAIQTRLIHSTAIDSGLKFIFQNQFDLLVSIKLMVKLNMNLDCGVAINYEKIRYNLFDSIAFYLGETEISRIDSRLLEALEGIYLTDTQKKFNLFLDRKGEIIINLPFWISPQMPLPLLILNICSMDIRIFDPQIPEGSECFLELDGVYLDTAERQKLSKEYHKLRIHNWAQIQQSIDIGSTDVEVDFSCHREATNCPCDRIIFMVEKINSDIKKTFDYLSVGNIQLTINGHEYCQTNGNLLLAKLADQNLFPNKSIYLLDLGSHFGENISLYRIDTMKLKIYLNEILVDKCQLTIYLHCDCNLQLFPHNVVIKNCSDPLDSSNPTWEHTQINTFQDNFNGGIEDNFNGGIEDNFNGGIEDNFNGGIEDNFNGGIEDNFNGGIQELGIDQQLEANEINLLNGMMEATAIDIPSI